MELNRNTVTSKSILCDIEGTTSSIDFVKETLFPYALKNVEKFLEDNWERDDVKESVIELRKLAEKDTEEKVDGAVPVLGDDDDKSKIIESVVKSVEWLMGSDRKVTPLKTLQGLIWENGYKDGSIKGHIYDDVPKAFENWTKTGHKIYIYSSGSVMAQKLLFGNTSHGDMQPHLAGYFDTKIGAKLEKESYEAIAKEIECATNEIVFLTDVVKEAKAAQEAGMNVVIVVRPGNASLTDEDKKDFPIVETFDGITLEEVTTGKRKIQEVVENKQETTRPPKLAKVETEEVPEKIEEEVTDTKAKTDDEPKCDTAAEKKEEIDRTDGTAKVDQETEKKVDEKMETDEEVTTEGIKEPEEVKAVEEKPIEEKVVAVEEKKDEIVVEEKVEKMEVDGVAEKKCDEIIKDDVEAKKVEKVAENEPEKIAEETPVVIEATVETTTKEVKETEKEDITPKEPEESCSKEVTATEVTEEPKVVEEVVNGKGDDKVEVEAKKVAEEVPKVVEETVDKEVAKEEEKAAGSTNGDVAAAAAVDGVNGAKKVDEEVKETENGKDEEVKNGHNADATATEVKDGTKDADAPTGSDQVSEVIVKKCVEPMVKSPIPQPVEAES